MCEQPTVKHKGDAVATTDLFELLKSDHRKVQALLEKMLKGGASKSKQQNFEKFQTEFLGHAAAEEKLLYPMLIEQSDQPELGHMALEEHRAARMVLKDLIGLKPNDERWIARCQVMAELINHHIEEEESEVFDAFGEIIDEEQSKQLAKQFQQSKKQGPSRMAA